MRQPPQTASSELSKASLSGGGSAPAAEDGGSFTARVWLPGYACLCLCGCVRAWRVLFMLLDITALPRHQGHYLSSPLCWRVATQTHSGASAFSLSSGKFHLTLSSGTRTGIRFVDDEVLLSEFHERGTRKRLQLLSKSTTPITEFICIYKWHISGTSPWQMCTPSTENLLIFPAALHALHTFGKMWCLTLLPDLAMIETLLAGKSCVEVLYLSVSQNPKS